MDTEQTTPEVIEDKDETQAADQPSEAKVRSDEAKRYRLKAKAERKAKNDAQARIAELEATMSQRASQFEAEKQQAFGQVSETKALLDKLAADHEALKASRAAEQSRIKSRLVSAHLRSELATAGVVQRPQQDLLLPALIARVDAELTDDFEVTCDVGDAIKVAVEAFGIVSEPEPEKPGFTRAAMIMQQQLPAADRTIPQAPVRQRFRGALGDALHK
jgi:hypothetical protein